MADYSKISQNFLDSSQYQESSILEYELVYGENFVSPGGLKLAREMIGRMSLQPGDRVLDVGCGLGGSSFVMASEFGLRADGIDLSRNMLTLANRKLAANGLSAVVSLQWGDCLELDRSEIYDGVYSRDVFLHIGDKARLFSVLRTALHHGGKLLFTDYCCGPKPWNADFADYVEARGYSLHTIEDYVGLIADAGFTRVAGEDFTARFIEILRADLDRIERLDLDETVRGKLSNSWRQKLERATAGDHRWALFTAVNA